MNTPLQRIHFRIQPFRRAYRILIARYFQLNVLRHRFLRLGKLLSMIIIIIRAPIGGRPSIPRVVVRHSQLLILHRVVSPVRGSLSIRTFCTNVPIGPVRLARHLGNLTMVIGNLQTFILYLFLLSRLLRHLRGTCYISDHALLCNSFRGRLPPFIYSDSFRF